MGRRRCLRVLLASGLAWCLLVLVSACSGSREWVYEKSGATPAQLDHDRTTCRKIAASRTVFNAFDAERVDRDQFNRCMQSRGYKVKETPLP